MAVRRPLLLALAAVAVAGAAVLFATLNRHHTTPEVPPIRELSTAETLKILSALHVPRSFNRSTRCPGETERPEVCFIRRPPVAPTRTRINRWVGETGLTSPSSGCLQGHGRYLCVGNALRGTIRMNFGLTSKTSGWTRPNIDSADNRNAPPAFVNGTTLRVGVVGENTHHS